MDNLFKKGGSLEGFSDSYVEYAKRLGLNNYKIYTSESLIKSPSHIRGRDIPEHVFDFIARQAVLGIANIVEGHVMSIVFKELGEKNFLTYGARTNIPYGLGELEKFEYGDPIVVVEGQKDRDALRQIYPYVISGNTAGLSMVSREILRTLTNKIVLAFDNDETGNHSFYRERKILKSDFDVIRLEHPQGVKDCGSMIDKMIVGDMIQQSLITNWYEVSLITLLGDDYYRIKGKVSK